MGMMQKQEYWVPHELKTIHYFLRGKSIKETEEKLAKYYKESVPSHGMVHKWFTEYRSGRTSTRDAERPGRPKEVTSRNDQ